MKMSSKPKSDGFFITKNRLCWALIITRSRVVGPLNGRRPCGETAQVMWLVRAARLILCGEWSKVVSQFSVLFFSQRIRVEWIVGSSIFSSGTVGFWEALQKTMWVPREERGCGVWMEVRVRCHEVWAVVTAAACWVESGINQWEV